jgi:ADP-ribose pyrophosphatase YjhB (NUDIX family)
MPHIHDKIDFTASAFIVCGDRVLLRFHEKIHLWLVPGGHIELDHDPIETIYKEMREEVGLEVKIIADPIIQFKDETGGHDFGQNLPLPMFLNRHRINANHEHVDFIYAAESKSMVISPQEGENSNPEHFRWVTAEELEKLDDVSASIKHFALTALKKVQNK